jgi:hypothetical protein
MPRLVRTPLTTPWLVTSPPAPSRPREPIPCCRNQRGRPCTDAQPCLCDATWPPRAPKACTPFPCAVTSPSHAHHARLHGTVTPSRRHPHPAPWCTTTDPATHRIGRNVSKNGRLATQLASHRHRHPYPCTQTTTPSKNTALAVQSHLMQTTADCGDDVEQTSLCVVIDQPVGNPKRKV